MKKILAFVLVVMMAALPFLCSTAEPTPPADVETEEQAPAEAAQPDASRIKGSIMITLPQNKTYKLLISKQTGSNAHTTLEAFQNDERLGNLGMMIDQDSKAVILWSDLLSANPIGIDADDVEMAQSFLQAISKNLMGPMQTADETAITAIAQEAGIDLSTIQETMGTLIDPETGKLDMDAVFKLLKVQIDQLDLNALLTSLMAAAPAVVSDTIENPAKPGELLLNTTITVTGEHVNAFAAALATFVEENQEALGYLGSDAILNALKSVNASADDKLIVNIGQTVTGKLAALNIAFESGSNVSEMKLALDQQDDGMSGTLTALNTTDGETSSFAIAFDAQKSEAGSSLHMTFTPNEQADQAIALDVETEQAEPEVPITDMSTVKFPFKMSSEQLGAFALELLTNVEQNAGSILSMFMEE